MTDTHQGLTRQPSQLFSKLVAQERITQHYSSLLAMFEQSVGRYANHIAFSNLGASLSYRQLDERSRDLAAYFQHTLGVAVGQRVGVMLPNCLQYPIVFFALIRCGAIAVNINPLYTARELRHQLNDSGANTVVIMSNFAHTLEAVIEESPVKHVIVTELGDEHPILRRTLINFTLNHVKKKVPRWQLPHQQYRHCLAKGKSLPYQRPSLTLDDIALLQYTGGTTGVAKGAMLTHGNLLANIEQIKKVYGDRLSLGEERILSVLPLYHIFALMINCLLFVELGGSNLLITNPIDIDNWVKSLKKYKFTVISGVNTLYTRLFNHAMFRQLDFSSLKISVAGGMPMQPDIAQKWQTLTGSSIIEGYGLTECSPLVTVNALSTNTFTGTIGVPIASTEIMLLSEQSEPVPLGQPGELCVRGPQVMKGYWQQPSETAAVMDANGWLHTGDIALITEQGVVKLVDRKKNIILVSGFNVYPSEIESVLNAHPLIDESAAIGVPDEVSGEAVKIFVVRNDRGVTAEQIILYCREQLTGYKVPKLIEFRDSLPKNPLGKILRHTLTTATTTEPTR
ncbi:AMP-binding protein [Rosenbergiella australiborealis]|uniref:Long-chain-fatty-acid--CoA ligase n=1 Tax=Rosenbergiella australiborealis TaxID=1544696 RepID=A0ABS5T4A5_9GAMM|nr:AMP-binding protein [Rosenbergiella australiborealis]MBT0726300.1 AMP-binding protein [Rosenbergiella australiborealis]